MAANGAAAVAHVARVLQGMGRMMIIWKSNADFMMLSSIYELFNPDGPPSQTRNVPRDEEDHVLRGMSQICTRQFVWDNIK